MADSQDSVQARWAPSALITDAIHGSTGAVDRLIAEIWPACYRLAASVLGDVNLANDAAQEACIVVHGKIATLRHPAAFDAWIYRIVIRESRRVRRRQPAGPDVPEGCALPPDPGAALDVWSALDALPPALREVTVLFYIDDLQSRDIASILSIPHATVRTRLARARERLRAILGDYDSHPHSAKEAHQHAL